MTGTRQRRAHGFTLIELLAAITLLALLTAILMGTVRGAERSTSAATEVGERTEQYSRTQAFLREHLASLLPMRWRRGGATTQICGPRRRRHLSGTDYLADRYGRGELVAIDAGQVDRFPVEKGNWCASRRPGPGRKGGARIGGRCHHTGGQHRVTVAVLFRSVTTQSTILRRVPGATVGKRTVECQR